MNWIDANERKPTHAYTVVVWVVGSPIHHGEDYLDVGIYNRKRDRWQTERGGDDVVVDVSHWMAVPPPGERGETEAVPLAVTIAPPDLLAAARRAFAVLKAQGESVRSGNVLGALDAAIRKAEGRTT